MVLALRRRWRRRRSLSVPLERAAGSKRVGTARRSPCGHPPLQTALQTHHPRPLAPLARGLPSGPERGEAAPRGCWRGGRQPTPFSAGAGAAEARCCLPKPTFKSPISLPCRPVAPPGTACPGSTRVAPTSTSASWAPSTRRGTTPPLTYMVLQALLRMATGCATYSYRLCYVRLQAWHYVASLRGAPVLQPDQSAPALKLSALWAIARRSTSPRLLAQGCLTGPEGGGRRRARGDLPAPCCPPKVAERTVFRCPGAEGDGGAAVVGGGPGSLDVASRPCRGPLPRSPWACVHVGPQPEPLHARRSRASAAPQTLAAACGASVRPCQRPPVPAPRIPRAPTRTA